MIEQCRWGLWSLWVWHCLTPRRGRDACNWLLYLSPFIFVEFIFLLEQELDPIPILSDADTKRSPRPYCCFACTVVLEWSTHKNLAIVLQWQVGGVSLCEEKEKKQWNWSNYKIRNNIFFFENFASKYVGLNSSEVLTFKSQP
jgi:hypothetical protein